MSSSRLPGKVMLPLTGKPLILRMYERVVLSKFSGKIVIAITDEMIDDELLKVCTQNIIETFRGNSFDLLDRHYKTAKK